jgi:SAM-dependent methyltransferase
VLPVSCSNPRATLVGDLTSAEHLPGEAFDCAIVTQTLHLIFDYRAALRSLHRILRPGGVLLLTVPGISQMSFDDWAATWYWSFTPLAMQKLVAELFGHKFCEVHTFGNVLAATAFLQGIAAEELTAAELAAIDKHYPCVITVRAVKARPTNESQ